MPRLAGKVAVVTGATSGIGLAIVKRLAAEGTFVYLTGRRKPQVDEAVELIGSNACGVQADSADLADLDRLYAQIAGDGRRLDIVVACVGDGGYVTLEQVTEQHVDDVVNANIRGTLFTVQKALPLLNDSASIILIGSLAADKGFEGLSVHAGSKAAVRSFARSWARELGGRGIRVNVISPGIIKTPGLASSLPDPSMADEIYSAMGGQTPLGRLGEADEIAGVAFFLASSDSSYITGIDIRVDGGRDQM